MKMVMNMKKNIIFDMDGLLIDSEKVTFEGYQHVLKDYGKEITLSQYQTFLGRTVPVIYGQLKDYYGNVDSEEIVAKVHAYMEDVFEHKGVPVKPGLYELIDYLKENAYKIAVATSSSKIRAEKILSRIGIRDALDVLVCGDEIQKGKPDPEIFLVAANKLNAQPCQCYVIEDAQSGIMAGYAGGFDVINIPDMKYPCEEYAAKATIILDTLTDVIDYLKGNIKNDFDFHMHSIYSLDGQYTCKELVDIAKSNHIKTIALADHDQITGVKEIIDIGKKEGIQIIPAIELSTTFHDYDVHLLGYGIDVEYPYFKDLPELTRKRMQANMALMMDKFKEVYGIEVDKEAILQSDSIWFTLMEAILSNETYNKMELFKDYIPGGKRSGAAIANFYWDQCQKGSSLYVGSSYPSLQSSIDIIHKAGGLAIIAHPFRTFYHNEDYLKEVIEMGIDGIEAYSNYHTPEMNAYYDEFAKKYGLLITCGSDFHGKKKPEIQMGEYNLNKDGTAIVHALLEALEKK